MKLPDITLHKVRELQYGTDEYNKLVNSVEDDLKKKEGYFGAIAHFCGVKHYVKNFPITEADLKSIDKNCVCNDTSKHWIICSNGHFTESSYSLNVVKDCKVCRELINIHASTFETEDMKEKRIRDAEDNQRYLNVEKQIKERKEQAEIEKQARILARAEQMKEEMKHDFEE